MPLSDTGLSSHLLSRACEWHASGSCPDSCGQDPTSCGRWCSAEAPTSAAKSPATPWATLLQDDISVLRSRQPRLSSMPDPELEWGPWADLLTNFPREWSELVAACFSPDSSVAKSRSDPTVGEAAGHTCTQCGAAFFSGKALAQHARIAHGTRSEWHRYIGKTAFYALACGRTLVRPSSQLEVPSGHLGWPSPAPLQSLPLHFRRTGQSGESSGQSSWRNAPSV